VLYLIALPPFPTGPSPTHPHKPHPQHSCYLSRSWACTDAYSLLSFPICQLGFRHITPSHCSFPHDALNPPSALSPSRHVDTHSSPASLCQPPAIIVPLPPNTTRGPLLFVHNTRRDQATRRARQARTQPQRYAAQQQPQPSQPCLRAPSWATTTLQSPRSGHPTLA